MYMWYIHNPVTECLDHVTLYMVYQPNLILNLQM